MPNPIFAPFEWPRDQAPTKPDNLKTTLFKTTIYESCRLLFAELELFKARNYLLHIDARIGPNNGVTPKAGHLKGAYLTFKRENQDYAFACDSYDSMVGNVRAIRETVKAMRTIERHGSTQMLSASMQGFIALAPASTKEAWHEVLGTYTGAGVEEIKAAYKRLCKIAHPDAGGSKEKFVRIQQAYEEALKLKGGKA